MGNLASIIYVSKTRLFDIYKPTTVALILSFRIETDVCYLS